LFWKKRLKKYNFQKTNDKKALIQKIEEEDSDSESDEEGASEEAVDGGDGDGGGDGRE
jgi:hypothetical protein